MEGANWKKKKQQKKDPVMLLERQQMASLPGGCGVTLAWHFLTFLPPHAIDKFYPRLALPFPLSPPTREGNSESFSLSWFPLLEKKVETGVLQTFPHVSLPGTLSLWGKGGVA